jgi:hypothetical protein
MVFEDCEEGVSLNIESDPPLPHRGKLSNQDSDLTDAQHMALSVAQMMSEKHGDDKEFSQDESSCSHTAEIEEHACQRNSKPEGVCTRHKNTPPESCCQH